MSGNSVKTMNFEISHFDQDDNELVMYLGGAITIAMKTTTFRPWGEISNINRTLMKKNKIITS